MLISAMTENMHGYLAETVALAAVAAIGYLVGQRSRRAEVAPGDEKLHHELSRAAVIAKELQQIAGRIRQDVATHQSNIAQFKERVSGLQSEAGDDGWQALGAEAESLLTPTMKLATDLSLAYDQLRKQSLQLMNFAGSRNDPQTGLFNRRAMEEQLEVQFSLHEQNNSRFSLALFSIDGCSDRADYDALVCDFASLLESSARDTDVVARYGSDEFVALMPQTSLAGAMIFSERFLRRASEELPFVVAGGVVSVHGDDDVQKLLSRADSALYSARAEGTSCLYRHDGDMIRAHQVDRRSELSPADWENEAELEASVEA